MTNAGSITREDGGVEQAQPRTAILRLAMALVVLGVVYLGVATFLSKHVPSNTRVDRIAIGGMTPDDAAATLKRVLAAKPVRPVHLRTPARTLDLDPGTVGLELDPDATLSELTGFTLDPRLMWEHLTGGEDQPLKTRVDRAKLAAAVTQTARAVDTVVREGSITFAGTKVTTVLSQPGAAVDVAATTDAIASAWPARQVVQAVMSATVPKVSANEIARAAREFAIPAVSGPVNVVVGRTALPLLASQFAPMLSMVDDGAGRLRPEIDSARLVALIRALDRGVERAPVDATVRVVAGKPQVAPAVIGARLDQASVPAPFLTALTSPARTARIPLVPLPAKVSTAMAQAWGIREEISTFTTHFPLNPPRTNNMSIAASTLNGTIVAAGTLFSLNRVLGERTPAKGYQRAPVIYAGRLEKAYGGGVSQVSTTTFNAAFFAGVKIEEHTPHSFYISRYPEGREATLSWPGVDQKWTNDTGSAILIDAHLTGSDLTVTLFGTKTWDVEAVKGPRRNVVAAKNIVDRRLGCVPQAATPGFDVTVTRIFKRNGELVRTSTFDTHYIPEDHVTCTPSPTR